MGGAHGLAGCTLRARKKAARCTAVAHGTTVVSSGSCSGELCLCISDCACVGEGCAACSESQWQRAPTLSVASVVECPRLATGLAVSIEASPELPGVSPKRRPQNAGGRSGTARERRRGGNQQNVVFLFFPQFDSDLGLYLNVDTFFPQSQGQRGTIEIPVTA